MRVAVVEGRARTTTGTLDLTVSGFGVPKAALFYIGRIDDGPAVLDGMVIGAGATDGVRDRACATSSEHNVADTDCYVRAKTGKCLLLLNQTDGSIDGEAQFDSWITDGVRIDFTAAFSIDYYITCVLFTGDDLQAYVGDFDTTSASVDVTAPGFRPTIVHVFSARCPIDDTVRADSKLSIGQVRDDGTVTEQQSLNWLEVSGATVGSPQMHFSIAHATLDVATAVAQQLGTFDSSGFTATRIGGAGYASMYLALKCDNRTLMRQIQAPATVSSVAYNIGFRPNAVLTFATRMNSTQIDTTVNSLLAGSWGLGVFSSPSVQYMLSAQVGKNSDPTDTSVHHNALAFHYANHVNAVGATVGIVGECTSIDDVGFTIDWTAVTAVERECSILAIQELTSTSPALQSAAATTSIAAQTIHQSDPTLQAEPATTALSGQVVHQGDLALQAETATAALAAQPVHQGGMTLQASTATASFVAQVIHQSDLALQASSATAQMDANVVHQSDLALQAETATTSLTAQVVHQADVVAQAETATALLDSQPVRQGSATLQASPATSTLGAQLVHQAVVSAQADTATASFDAAVVHQTDLALQAETATASFVAQVIHQADLVAQADSATASIDGQLVHQVDLVLQAETATALIVTELLGSVAATLDAQASPATAAISAQTVHQGTLSLQAETAEASIAGQVVHQADLALQANPATASIVAQRVINVTFAAQASPATISLVGQRVRDAELVAQAEPAVMVLGAQVVHQTDLDLQASPASSSFLSELVSNRLTLQAETATAHFVAQVVHQFDLVLQAERATSAFVATATGQGLQASLAMQAETATASFVAQVVHQADIDAYMGDARVRILGYPIVWYDSVTIFSPASDNVLFIDTPL